MRPAPGDQTLPPRLVLDLPKLRDLRYGENPHQKAAWYGRGRDGFGAVDVLQGKELSFTNLLDLDSAARIVLEFTEPAAAVIKHTNPCGAATGASAAEAYVRAREADALAAFGGIVGLNRPIDVETAKRHHLDVHRSGHRPRHRRGGAVADGEEAEHAGRRGQLRPAARGDHAGSALDSGRSAGAGARRRVGSAWRLARRARPQGGHQAVADGRGVAGDAVCVARLRAREVQHHHLHQRPPDAGDWRRADEPRRRGEDRGREGAGVRRVRQPAGRLRGGLRRVLPVPRRPGRGGRRRRPAPSCSRAARCATPR